MNGMIPGVCVFALLFTLQLFGQDDSSRILKPIAIHGEYDSISKVVNVNSAVPQFTLNADKLSALSVLDIGAAFKYVPGVQLKDYGGIGGIKTVSFRSLGATHTNVNVDGIRVPNVQSGSVNLSSFETFGVQELVFTTGQTEEHNVSASAYLSANSIAVKSILAQKPEKINVSLYSSASSISSYEEGILVLTPVTKNIYFGVQAMTKFGLGNYSYLYESGGITVPQKRLNSKLNQYKVRSVIGFDFKNSHTLISANYYNNEQQLPGALILYNPSNDQKMWNEDFKISVLHNQTIGKWKLVFNSFHQSSYLRYFDPDFLNLQGYIDNTFLQKNTAGGVLIKRVVFNERVFLFGGSDLIYSQLKAASVLNSPERLENNSVIGVKSKFRNFTLESNLTLQLISDKYYSNDTLNRKDYAECSPFFSVSWMPFKSEAIRFRSFYKRAFSMPTFNDLYYNFIGNTNLKPEKAHLLNFGITYLKDLKKWHSEFTADGFYNQIQDKIIAIPTKDLFNWSMQNIGKIQTTGFDLSMLITYSLNDWRFTVNGSYTYNLSLDMSDSQSTTYGSQIPYTPFHSATYGIAVSFKEFMFNLNGLYTGFRYTLNENIYANYLESFSDISLSLSKNLVLSKKIVLGINGAVMNVLNKNYEVVKSFPMPGRYYQVTLKLNLK